MYVGATYLLRMQVVSHNTLPTTVQGEHPAYPAMTCGVEALGDAERFMAQVALRVPRFAQRVACLTYMTGLPEAVQDVQVRG